MKKWNKPQIFSLGIESTFTGCSCDTTALDKDPEKNTHLCHRDNKWHQNNCPSLGEGHDQSAKCPTEGIHEWAGQPHKSKCCCGTGLSVS